MKKIPTLFERDWDGDRSRVIDKVTPGCEWVLAGEGTPYRKLDGTCCMVRDRKFYKRREVKQGRQDPDGFELSEEDPKTGKRVGWVLVGEGPEDQYHRSAFNLLSRDAAHDPDGTYELVGPKIQGNPERCSWYELVGHSDYTRLAIDMHTPHSFEDVRNCLENRDIEGIVWHHPDGRMAKIKLRDFGLKRNRR